MNVSRSEERMSMERYDSAKELLGLTEEDLDLVYMVKENAGILNAQELALKLTKILRTSNYFAILEKKEEEERKKMEEQKVLESARQKLEEEYMRLDEERKKRLKELESPAKVPEPTASLEKLNIKRMNKKKIKKSKLEICTQDQEFDFEEYNRSVKISNENSPTCAHTSQRESILQGLFSTCAKRIDSVHSEHWEKYKLTVEIMLNMILDNNSTIRMMFAKDLSSEHLTIAFKRRFRGNKEMIDKYSSRYEIIKRIKDELVVEMLYRAEVSLREFAANPGKHNPRLFLVWSDNIVESFRDFVRIHDDDETYYYVEGNMIRPVKFQLKYINNICDLLLKCVCMGDSVSVTVRNNTVKNKVFHYKVLEDGSLDMSLFCRELYSVNVSPNPVGRETGVHCEC